MKKITSLFVLLTAVTSLSLTACTTPEGTPDQNVETPGVTPTEEPVEAPTDSE